VVIVPEAAQNTPDDGTSNQLDVGDESEGRDVCSTASFPNALALPTAM
jgi:hypothetical protein